MKVFDTYLEEVILDAEKAIGEGEYIEGRNMLESILQYEPGYAKVHNLLGWLYLYYLSDDARAEMHLKLAAKFDPFYKPPYLHLTDLYLRNENYHKLEEFILKAKEVKGISKYLVYERLGIVEEARGNFSKAIENYRNAIFHSMDNYDIDEMKSNIKRCKFKKFRFLKLKWLQRN